MASTKKTEKHPGGRPLKYKTVKELEDAIAEYFEYCDNRTKSVFVAAMNDSIMVSDPAPYTMAGLARAVGLSRQGLLNYANKDKFFDAIKAARDRVEEYAESQLYEGRSAAGVIFNLKNNFGWKDKTEQDINVKEAPTPLLAGLAPAKLVIEDNDGGSASADDSADKDKSA